MATTPRHGFPRPNLGEPADIEVVGQAVDELDTAVPLGVAGVRIQTGRVTCPASGSDFTSEVEVFAVPFSSAPVVMVVSDGNSYASASVGGISATGFTARLRRVGGGVFGSDTNVDYVAIGPS